MACSILISILIGFESISNSTNVATANSRERLSLICKKIFIRCSICRNFQNKIETLAKEFGKNTDGAMTFYIRFNPNITSPTSGIFYSKSSENSDFGKLTPTDFSQYDPSDTEHVEWYYIPVNTKKPVWLDPYLNSNINVYMVSYVVPIFKDGESIGVVGMDIDFKNIESVVNGTKVYDSGYAFLLNNKYGVVCHPDLAIDDNSSTTDNGSLKALTDEISNNSYNNKQLSQNLNEIVNRFK